MSNSCTHGTLHIFLSEWYYYFTSLFFLGPEHMKIIRRQIRSKRKVFSYFPLEFSKKILHIVLCDDLLCKNGQCQQFYQPLFADYFNNFVHTQCCWLVFFYVDFLSAWYSSMKSVQLFLNISHYFSTACLPASKNHTLHTHLLVNFY